MERKHQAGYSRPPPGQRQAVAARKTLPGSCLVGEAWPQGSFDKTRSYKTDKSIEEVWDHMLDHEASFGVSEEAKQLKKGLYSAGGVGALRALTTSSGMVVEQIITSDVALSHYTVTFTRLCSIGADRIAPVLRFCGALATLSPTPDGVAIRFTATIAMPTQEMVDQFVQGLTASITAVFDGNEPWFAS